MKVLDPNDPLQGVDIRWRRDRHAPNDIGSIALRILDGAKCQRDLDARKGDFIAALNTAGWVTPVVGKITWHDEPYTGGGIALGPEPHHIVITGWTFGADNRAVK